MLLSELATLIKPDTELLKAQRNEVGKGLLLTSHLTHAVSPLCAPYTRC